MLIYGHDAQIAAWVCKQLELKPYPAGMYRAVGIINSHGKLIGGVIWHNYHEDNWSKPLLIEATIATVDKRWATRHTLEELFQYPFRQLGVKRVQATCSRKAKRVRSTLSRLGFKFEGICREAHPKGGDAAHYSMLKPECFWIKDGKIITVTPRRARSSSHGYRSNGVQSSNGSIPSWPQ